MEALKIIPIIKNTISNHRDKVMDVLYDSNLRVDENISDSNIFNLINVEINEKGNTLLATNMASLITNIYDFDPLFKPSEKDKSHSNFEASSSPKEVMIIGLNNEKKTIKLN